MYRIVFDFYGGNDFHVDFEDAEDAAGFKDAVRTASGLRVTHVQFVPDDGTVLDLSPLFTEGF